MHICSADVTLFRKLDLRHGLFFTVVKYIKTDSEPNIKIFIFHFNYTSVYNYTVDFYIYRQSKISLLQTKWLHFYVNYVIMHIYYMHLHLIFLLLIRRDISKKQYACTKIKYKKEREKIELTEMLKQALPFYVVMGLVMFWFIRLIVRSVKLHFAKKIAARYPTEQNAMKVYKLLCTFGIAINNHPKTWGEYRNMFYKINQSSDVPSELKQKLKLKLVAKGLYIDNMRIIDNCKL